MIVKVEKNEKGDTYITLPDEIIEKLDLKEGDDVHFKLREDDSIEITFYRPVTVKDLEIGDHFDMVIEDVEKGKRFTIYQDDKCVAMMIPYKEF